MTSITPINGSGFSSYLNGANYQSMSGIASSSDGSIIYVCMAGASGAAVMKSTDHGYTWTNVYPSQMGFYSIACSSNGNIVYAANLGDGLYKSTNAGTSWNKISFSPNNTLPGGAANPESPTGGSFPGYELSNIYKIACDSTGTKLIMTTNAAASIYRSIDSGVTWSFLVATPGWVSNPTAPTTLASNGDGTVLYAALNNTSSKTIIVSNNSGATWTNLNMLGVTGPFNTLGTNSYGDFVFGVDGSSQLNIFYPTHIDKALLVPSAGNTLVAVGIYNNGNNIIISQNNYSSYTDGAVVTYSIVNKYPPGQQTAVVSCFRDDSKILCFINDEEVYVKVQDIRPGHLIKTLKNGYVPVNMIGTTKLYNSGDSTRGQNRLYLCSPTEYPDLTEDLIITGCHSILVDTLTDFEKNNIIEILGRLMVTDHKYRLMAHLDNRASPYSEEGVFNIWHIALDNENNYSNYGIYANGLLVETCSKRYLKELSGMKLLQ